jgi:inorganic pyrophosphatase
MGDWLRGEHALDRDCATVAVVAARGEAKSARSFCGQGQNESELGGWLSLDAGFVLDLGSALSTRAERGAPLDVLVLGAERLSGRATLVRLIGVLEADETQKGRTCRCDHAVAVSVTANLFERVRDITDLSAEQLSALIKAWSAYKGLQAASFQVVAAAGAAEALRLIERFSTFCDDPGGERPRRGRPETD